MLCARVLVLPFAGSEVYYLPYLSNLIASTYAKTSDHHVHVPVFLHIPPVLFILQILIRDGDRGADFALTTLACGRSDT